MTDCIIVFRNPRNGAIGIIREDDDSDDPFVLPDRDAAIAFAQSHPLLRAWPFQILELDEL